MADNIIKTRIQQRYDTLANWESKNPLLLVGEVARVKLDDGTVRTKTGTGSTNFNSLPWDDQDLYNSIGDISTALDSILTIQNNLLGGNS